MQLTEEQVDKIHDLVHETISNAIWEDVCDEEQMELFGDDPKAEDMFMIACVSEIVDTLLKTSN